MKVDLDALVVAFSDDQVERSYYVDTDTGRVFNVLEDHEDPETQEIVWELEADTRGRYIHVPKPNIEERLEEQDAFVEALDDGPLKESIEKLLEDDHDGSKFADYVERNREAREAWREFRTNRSKKKASEWLASLDLQKD